MKPSDYRQHGRPGQRRIMLPPSSLQTAADVEAKTREDEQGDVGVCLPGSAYATLPSYVKSRGVVLRYSLDAETARCYSLCWEKRLTVKKVSVRRSGRQASLPAFPVVEILDVLYGEKGQDVSPAPSDAEQNT